jgi:hypothetical protein
MSRQPSLITGLARYPAANFAWEEGQESASVHLLVHDALRLDNV